jgi:hypothetical protein
MSSFQKETPATGENVAGVKAQKSRQKFGGILRLSLV